MPLTKEQFDKLDAEGFTPEEIAGFEKKRQSSIIPSNAGESGINQFAAGLMSQRNLIPKWVGMVDVPEELKNRLSSIPQPTSTGTRIARAAGQVTPDILTSAPFMGAAGEVKSLLPIARTALGGGAWGATKSAITGQGNPAQEALKDAVGFAAFHGAGKVGSTVGKSLIPKIGEQVGASVGAGIAGFVSGSNEDKFANAILGAGLQAISPAEAASMSEATRTKVASRVVNSLVRPTEKELRIGNAGRGISKEGIWGWSLEDIKNKAGEKLGYLNGKLDDLYNAHISKTNNYDNTIDPLYKLYSGLNQHPDTNRASIDRLADIIRDVRGVSNKQFKNFSNMTPQEARAFKQEIVSLKRAEFEKRGGAETGPSMIEKALNQVYRNIDTKLDKTVPGSEELNMRVTDLIDANDILGRRIRQEQGKPLLPRNWSLSALEDLLPPSVKTGVGALIAPKYKTQ